NEGKVGGMYENALLLLLTTTGKKSGELRITPLVYQLDGDRIIIVASHLGAPKHPDWYHNLVAHPQVTIEVGTETFEAASVVITGEERNRLYAQQAAKNPGFAEYETKTTRLIPVIALKR
ncbi:MAG TPA: nitroreductase family deazaflavin-dependent oxidoreductase, partial [Ktedonobacteraceae bacterium]